MKNAMYLVLLIAGFVSCAITWNSYPHVSGFFLGGMCTTGAIYAGLAYKDRGTGQK